MYTARQVTSSLVRRCASQPFFFAFASRGSRFVENAIPAPNLMPATNALQLQSRGMVTFIFVEPNGEEVEVECETGTSLLDVAHDHDIEMEGACGGECACSTCHVILEQGLYDSILEDIEIDEEEEDMLDLALGLTDTSRLGCQVKVTDAFEGIKITLPDEVESYY